MFCLSLSDLPCRKGVECAELLRFFDFVEHRTGYPIERIAVGSNFCSRYFLNIGYYESVFAACKQRGLLSTLVIPIPSQSHLDQVKDMFLRLREGGPIDEITVNDIGMLIHCLANASDCRCKINMGRMFFKEPRDVRLLQSEAKIYNPELELGWVERQGILPKSSIIEVDAVSRRLDLDVGLEGRVKVGLHRPYCYVSTGNYCKFGSIGRSLDHKFRLAGDCRQECLDIYEEHSWHDSENNREATLFRYGKTVYLKRAEVEFVGAAPDRIIYWPIDEWRSFSNENFGTLR